MGGDQGGELPRYRSHYPGLPAPPEPTPLFLSGLLLRATGKGPGQGRGPRGVFGSHPAGHVLGNEDRRRQAGHTRPCANLHHPLLELRLGRGGPRSQAARCCHGCPEVTAAGGMDTVSSQPGCGRLEGRLDAWPSKAFSALWQSTAHFPWAVLEAKRGPARADEGLAPHFWCQGVVGGSRVVWAGESRPPWQPAGGLCLPGRPTICHGLHRRLPAPASYSAPPMATWAFSDSPAPSQGPRSSVTQSYSKCSAKIKLSPLGNSSKLSW